MFLLTVQREFCAAHAVTMGGVRETTHGHNWKVTVEVGAERLDGDGMVCDFHQVEREMARILDGLNNRDLNETPPFDRVNPTAENVARHIGETLSASLPEGVSLRSASVTEAPGCRATWLP